ncbi:MAG: choice-of-anchor tandem repeat NxxGxxAF-containing protein [Planctomycetota bacterium]
MRIRRTIVGGLACCATACLAFEAGATVTYRTVALTGDAVPGAGPGVVFDQFVPGTMNSLGHTAFFATLAGPGVTTANRAGLWSETGGQLGLVARTGDAAPGVTGGTFGGFFVPTMNDSGQVAFKGLMFFDGAGIDETNNEGIWTGTGGALNLIARKGSPAPGTAAGVIFDEIDLFPALNNAGQASFYSSLVDTTGATFPREGYWSESTGPLTLIAHRELAAPGVTPGFVYRVFGPTLTTRGNNTITDGGTTVFNAFVGGPSAFDDIFDGLWTSTNGVTTPLAIEGEPVPGFGPGSAFGNLGAATINAAGETAFLADFDDGGGFRRGILVGDTGGFRVAARTSDQAPGLEPGVSFDTFSSPKLNGNGEVAFLSVLGGSGIGLDNARSLWRERDGALELIARAGDTAPGTGPGVNFSAFSAPAFNDAGQAAFFGQLVGSGVVADNDFGVWFRDPGGPLELLFREGDLFDVDDDPGVEDLRTVQSFSFAPNENGENGGRTGFNDAGQLSFGITFTDGTQGLFVATLTAGLTGDYNDSGQVEQGDLNLVLNNWGQPAPFTPNGGPFATPNVDQEELNRVLNNWGASSAPSFAVPEPGIFALLGTGLATILRRPR